MFKVVKAILLTVGVFALAALFVFLMLTVPLFVLSALGTLVFFVVTKMIYDEL